MRDTLSRRGFLQGAAALSAVAAASGASYAAWAASPDEQGKGSEVSRGFTLCNGCSSKCGLVCTVKGGRLWTVEGHKDHPYAKGTACGRAHGVAQMAYSASRITTPLRKTEDGSFVPCTWDEAFAEIGERVKKIQAESGPESIAMIQDPRPSGKYYSKRFINALGSANLYTHGCACNLSKESGLTEVIGTGKYSTDFGKAKMVMFVGRSYGDGIRPSSVQSVAAAADANCRVVLVDPRLNNTGIFATDWVPIVPGGDLAFLLGMCNVLIEEDLYNHEFIENETVGFDEFAAQCKEYTPEWAEGICGVSADRIRELARAMAKAAPAASIEPSWRAVNGCSYANSFETARAFCAVNALLGSFGQKGGALLTSTPSFGDLDPEKFPKVPKPKVKRVGDAEYPLVLDSMGSAAVAAASGKVKAFFFYNSNGARGYGSPKMWTKALEDAELVVTIDIQMSETAMQSDFVLPECSYIERMEVPEALGGKKHAVAMRLPVIDRIHPETKSCDEIFAGLAEACGVGKYFGFSVEELSEAQLNTVGTSVAEMREKGVVALPDPNFEYKVPKFKTKSGKLELSNEKVGATGMNPVISYIPRKVMPGEGEFFVIGGKQSIHSHTMTLPVESLNAISREYDMERIWMATADAEKLGIETGDLVEVYNDNHSDKVAVKVTERIMPGVLFVPSHYGGKSKDLSLAYGYGIDMSDYLDGDFEPHVGSIMSQEVAVKVRKVQA
ncbi:molybdopterin oxidoreductase [Berryella intestinalis]|uniref:Molybdopterin oxidoreductase n=1 Tax=Berryella intestinalis TaxID=1531429 RepID=A0A0A8B468_9ACTN|nr:molybdopterin-dependent oxidoreductase [Berryella intestinalis]AJC12129.1 molybdopterin oxidoreductase [Berryella intestinalis]